MVIGEKNFERLLEVKKRIKWEGECAFCGYFKYAWTIGESIVPIFICTKYNEFVFW